MCGRFLMDFSGGEQKKRISIFRSLHSLYKKSFLPQIFLVNFNIIKSSISHDLSSHWVISFKWHREVLEKYFYLIKISFPAFFNPNFFLVISNLFHINFWIFSKSFVTCTHRIEGKVNRKVEDGRQR